MKIRNICGILSLVLIVGCDKRPEAEKLGYRGEDISDNLSFYTTGAGTTNWVPARLLEVFENYALSANEAALLAALDMQLPGLAAETLPAGYSVDEEGPWLTAWKKPAAHLGMTGQKGFYSHYDDEAKRYETGEAYFSSYWKTREEALTAMENLKTRVAAAFGPLKMHTLPDGWIAEYLRLRVMCVTGVKPDGTWCCMLTLADKANPGCGAWEPLAAQKARRAEHLYQRALETWQEAAKKKQAENRAACAAALKAKGLPGIAEILWRAQDDGSHIFYSEETLASTNDVVRIWQAQRDLLKKAYGLDLPQTPGVQEPEPGVRVLSGAATNDTPYAARLDIAVFTAPARADKSPAPEGVDAGPCRRWRLIIREDVLPGHELPPRPVRGN